MAGRGVSTVDDRERWSWLIATLIACVGAAVLIYFGRQARTLWVDEEMLGLNVRDRPFAALRGPLWLGQAAPLGWLVLERASMLALGLSERAIRVLPVLWGLLTLITVVWVGRRWLGPVGAAVLAFLFSIGNHVWFFALELKQYSADTFGGLLLPSLAAWATQAPDVEKQRSAHRADVWWVVAGALQWFSYGALFVAPGCGAVLVALAWWRAGRRAAVRAAALLPFWVLCAGLHYYLSIRHASSSPYLRGYWDSAFPPVAAGTIERLQWFAGRLDDLALIPGGTPHWGTFWVVAIAGLVLGLRRGYPLAPLTLMLGMSVPVAFGLTALGLVPLSGRLSLWMLPALYLGIAVAADESACVLKASFVGRSWMTAAATGCGVVLIAWLCADIYHRSKEDMVTRRPTAHGLDDRAAIRSLMAQRHAGDAMLATHLGLPAVWWYGGVNLSDAAEGGSFQDGGPIFEIWTAAPGPDCAPDDLPRALSHVSGVAMYLGFELGDHFEDLVLNRLAELGTVVTYRRFADSGHAAVVALGKPPTGKILLPRLQTADPLVRPAGCITIKPAHRW